MPFKLLTIVQARTRSSRLPGKVLLPLAGVPLLVRMVERVLRSSLCGTVTIATSNLEEDDPIVKVCEQYNLNCFRGDALDLLDRHYQAALKYEADIVLKIPSDCPLIDPMVIDQTISKFISNPEQYDYVSNLHPPTYPDGNDVEIMSFEALKTAWKFASSALEREHTTPYIWDNPELFKIGNTKWESGLNFAASHRWTIDYLEDYEFIKKVYDELYSTQPEFNLEAVLDLLERKKAIFDINSKYAGQYWYLKHLDDLKTLRVSNHNETL